MVKDYLGKRDVYVHADLSGAGSVVIRNPTNAEVSPITLNEAAVWAVTHSKAWAEKVMVQAYWVWGTQVSKTPESGEYVGTGSFIIRGKKNFMSPAKLELGYTVIFMLDEDSVANHYGERKIRGLDEDDMKF